MGNSKNLFCLADTSEAWVLRDLSFAEVVAILRSRKRDLDKNLCLWTESWGEWKSLSSPEAMSFRLPEIKETQSPPPVPKKIGKVSKSADKHTRSGVSKFHKSNPKIKRDKTVTDFSMEKFIEQLAMSEGKSIRAQSSTGKGEKGNERRYARFEVHMPARIINNNNEHVTAIKNISEGGVQIEDVLPEHFAGYCQIILEPSRYSFELICSPVEDQHGGRRHLEFVDSDSQAEFIAWLRRQKWAVAS